MMKMVRNALPDKSLLRKRELSQLMPHHILRHEYWNEVLPVVYEESDSIAGKEDTRSA